MVGLCTYTLQLKSSWHREPQQKLPHSPLGMLRRPPTRSSTHYRHNLRDRRRTTPALKKDAEVGGVHGDDHGSGTVRLGRPLPERGGHAVAGAVQSVEAAVRRVHLVTRLQACLPRFPRKPAHHPVGDTLDPGALRVPLPCNGTRTLVAMRLPMLLDERAVVQPNKGM